MTIIQSKKQKKAGRAWVYWSPLARYARKALRSEIERYKEECCPKAEVALCAYCRKPLIANEYWGKIVWSTIEEVCLHDRCVYYFILKHKGREMSFEDALKVETVQAEDRRKFNYKDRNNQFNHMGGVYDILDSGLSFEEVCEERCIEADEVEEFRKALTREINKREGKENDDGEGIE